MFGIHFLETEVSCHFKENNCIGCQYQKSEFSVKIKILKNVNLNCFPVPQNFPDELSDVNKFDFLTLCNEM